jgi:MFS family permease
MEVYYHLGYAVMSLVFVGNAAGFIIAAFFTNMILDRLGRAKTLILAELFMLSAYVMLVVTPPYPVVIVAFFLLGYGMAINLALNNVFCANLNPSSAVLGAAHGSYGVGGIVAPIIGTAMVSKGILWSRFYFLPLGLRFFCIALAAWAFGSYEEDSNTTLLTALERTASRRAAEEPKLEKVKNLKSALMNKVTLFGALFIFAYQGAEVSISGWVISFLISYRDGDPASVGYVSSGFWVSPPSLILQASRIRMQLQGNMTFPLHTLHHNILIFIAGWHNTRSLPPDSPYSKIHRHKTIRLHPHNPLHRPSTPRLAHPQCHRQCGSCLYTWSASRPCIPLRTDSLLTPYPEEYSDDSHWLHCWGREFRRGRGAIYDRSFGSSGWDVGVASGLCGDVCCYDCMLGRVTAGEEEVRVDRKRTKASRPTGDGKNKPSFPMPLF